MAPPWKGHELIHPDGRRCTGATLTWDTSTAGSRRELLEQLDVSRLAVR